MTKPDPSQGAVTIDFWRLAIHLIVAIAVALGVTTLLERYGGLPHWAVAHNAHGRSLAGIIGLGVALLVRRAMDRFLPLAERPAP